MITKRLITYTDYNRLMDQLYCDFKEGIRHPASLHHLYLLLETSRKCTSEDIPEDVITMNSHVIIRNIGTGIKRSLVICYPGEYSIGEAKDNVSIYDPLGLALLGRKEREIVGYFNRNVTGKEEVVILVERILFQPDANGLFVL